MRPRILFASFGSFLGLLTVAGAPRAANSAPFHGVTLVEGPSDAMAIVDLCAAGVSVRTTQYAEREATPETWAQKAAVDAQIATNADFFDFPGWTYVVGRARGGGQDWPANEQDREARPYWTFGKYIAALEQNGAVAPGPATDVTDIVGGHNFLILGGKTRGPAFDGDPTVTTAHRRTGVGLSADHQFLFVYSSDASLDGNQMVANMFARATAGGHANGIDVATNMDGGGSSQMYVAGRGQIITSGRLVNNHLGIRARGTGPAVNCPYAPPAGDLDSVSCDAVAGWSQSPTAKTSAIDVHIYYGGPTGTAGVPFLAATANVARKDLCAPLGSCNHAFSQLPPLSLFDGKAHPVHAYGLNSNAAGEDAELVGSPKNMTCAALPLTGVKRWIKDPVIFAAWKFSAFEDEMPVTDAALGAVPAGSELGAAPVLAKGDDGSAAIYWIDGTTKRHIVSQDVAAAWHFDLTKTTVMPIAKLTAMPDAAALTGRPVLVKGAGAAVYLLDIDPAVPVLPDGGLGSSSGSSGGSGGGDASVGSNPDGGASSSGAPGNADAPGAPTDGQSGCSASSTARAGDAGALAVMVPLAFVAARLRRRRSRA